MAWSVGCLVELRLHMQTLFYQVVALKNHSSMTRWKEVLAFLGLAIGFALALVSIRLMHWRFAQLAWLVALFGPSIVALHFSEKHRRLGRRSIFTALGSLGFFFLWIFVLAMVVGVFTLIFKINW